MTNETCLDDVLAEIGNFGRYQRIVLCFVLFASIVAYFPAILWVFEAKVINYRCEITGCESDSLEYKPTWWTEAIPSVDNEPSQCEKYKLVSSSNAEESCKFNKSIIESCDKFVYETTEISILQDFNLHCEENLWKLTLVGTINSVGIFVGLPFSGAISDIFGRKTVIIGSVVLSSISGLIRSFSNSYIFFIIMQFIDSVCRAATYATCFIIGVEFVSPDKRVLVGVLISSFYALGGVIVGGAAWILLTWRTVDQILYGIALLVLFYYWLLPESIRWLLAKKRYEDVKKLLTKISKTNGTVLPEEKLEKLWISDTTNNTVKTNPLQQLLKSSILTKRFLLCSVCWVFTIFSFQGLTINAVALSGNSYLDFILAMLIEIPGNFTAYFQVDRIGRRYSLAVGYIICGVACISFIFTPEELYWLKLCMYLLGKFGASISVTVIYTITSEMFPTTLRSFLLSSCSMFGRIGSMVAPQMPLLALYWEPLPLALFAATAIMASGLSLLFPETMKTTLPDTVEEAENIGKKIKNEMKI